MLELDSDVVLSLIEFGIVRRVFMGSHPHARSTLEFDCASKTGVAKYILRAIVRREARKADPDIPFSVVITATYSEYAIIWLDG